MDHFEAIYAGQAGPYHRMVAAEDVDGNLLPALERAAPMRGRHVLDLGSGTGRIPLLLRGVAARVTALELSAAMLREQRLRREESGENWALVRGDMRFLPVADACADVVTAGWAIGHLTGWHPDGWRGQASLVLREMLRAAAPGGALVVMETMTTGALAPAPPSPVLAEYYTWLEGEWGFRREVIQTDYRFADVDEAVACTRFFFGDELAEKIRANGWARLPEWTGVWSRPV